MIEGRFCPPTACSLRVAMIGNSARPAGSLGKMLHQFCEQAEGGHVQVLLQVLAAESAYRGTADSFDSIRDLPVVTHCMVRPRVARGFRRAGGVGLASMYPASEWSALLR